MTVTVIPVQRSAEPFPLFSWLSLLALLSTSNHSHQGTHMSLSSHKHPKIYK